MNLRNLTGIEASLFIVIGSISSIMCMIGLYAGDAVSKYLSSRAELWSGVILLVLAVAIVIGH